MLAAVGYGAKLHIESNSAWRTMVEDVQEAADIEKNQTWKNRKMHKMPLNRDGVEVNGSTYDRTAWAIAALTLIRENPMGYGLVNHSFGALALEKWPDFYPPKGKNRGATHSGWIDLTLGIGIPGLLLILIPLLAAMVRAKRADGYWHQYLALTIPVVLFVYLTTEVATGHYIEFLMFFAAFAGGLTLKPGKPQAPQ
jgi:O-antigen ligase